MFMILRGEPPLSSSPTTPPTTPPATPTTPPATPPATPPTTPSTTPLPSTVSSPSQPSSSTPRKVKNRCYEPQEIQRKFDDFAIDPLLSVSPVWQPRQEEDPTVPTTCHTVCNTIAVNKKILPSFFAEEEGIAGATGLEVWGTDGYNIFVWCVVSPFSPSSSFSSSSKLPPVMMVLKARFPAFSAEIHETTLSPSPSPRFSLQRTHSDPPFGLVTSIAEVFFFFFFLKSNFLFSSFLFFSFLFFSLLFFSFLFFSFLFSSFLFFSFLFFSFLFFSFLFFSFLFFSFLFFSFISSYSHFH